MDSTPRNIVIVGGGVMGCTTAYYLTRHPKYNPEIHTITIVEAAGIASSASGKAGGLLGLWAYPEETVPLSYRLHRELAEEHGGDQRWGYRRLNGCGTIRVNLQDANGAVLAPPPSDRDGGGGKGRVAKRSRKRKRDATTSSAKLRADTTDSASEETSRSPTMAPTQHEPALEKRPTPESCKPRPDPTIQAPARVPPQPELQQSKPQQPEPPQFAAQQLQTQPLEPQYAEPPCPEPQRPDVKIELLPLQKQPLEHQVEQMLQEQEQQPLSDKPVPVAVLFGLKTGSCTRWKSIFRYSNGDVTYGARVPDPPPRNDSRDTTDPRAVSPDRTISVACSDSGGQDGLSINDQNLASNNLEAYSSGNSAPLNNGDCSTASNSNSEHAPYLLGAPVGTGREVGPGLNASATNRLVPPAVLPGRWTGNGSEDSAVNRFPSGIADKMGAAGPIKPPKVPTNDVNGTEGAPGFSTAEPQTSVQNTCSDGAADVALRSREGGVLEPQNGLTKESIDVHMGGVGVLDATENGEMEPSDDGCIEVLGCVMEGAAQEPWHKVPKLDKAASASMTEVPLPAELDWVRRDVVSAWEEQGQLGRTETAQVHPYQFTTSMAALAQERGVNIRLGSKVTKIITSTGTVSGKSSSGGVGGVVRGVELLDRNRNRSWTMDAVTDVLVTAGPWTSALLPQAKVKPVRAHSVVWEADVSPFAVFTSITLPDGYVPGHRAAKGERRKHNKVDPEAYARPFGEVYACGEIDELVPLPATADLVEADESQCEDLITYLGLVSPQLASAPVKARQACYMPERKPHPVFGQTLTPGLWIAAGHSCWGIQHAPATGLLMAEMMMDGRVSSIEPGLIAKFDPRRAKI